MLFTTMRSDTFIHNRSAFLKDKTSKFTGALNNKVFALPFNIKDYSDTVSFLFPRWHVSIIFCSCIMITLYNDV